jgi:hypothetical protein
VYHFVIFRSHIPPEHDSDDSNVTWASFSEAQVSQRRGILLDIRFSQRRRKHSQAQSRVVSVIRTDV